MNPRGSAAAGGGGWRSFRPRSRFRLLGLRARVSLLFALGALGLSILLAVVTYLTVSRYLFLQRERATLRQTSANARVVQDALAASGLSPQQVLDGVHRAERVDGPDSLLLSAGDWVSASGRIGSDDLPPQLRREVREGQRTQQRVSIDGRPRLAVAVPLVPAGSAYVEVFPLDELTAALHTLAVVLTGAAALTTALGAVVGQWASRRALRPLSAVTAAASAIAEGHLDTRLDGGRDRQLGSLAASFNETADALQRRVQNDARFAADVSHELRSPLTTMVNAVEVLQTRRHELSASAADVLQLLDADVRRFERMVRELLEISRSYDGNADLVLEDVRIGELVRHAADATAGRPVTVVVPTAEALVVKADRRRLERVFVNLVENAERHGRGIDRVVVEPSAAGVRCCVDDEGPGVPQQHSARIFERFARGPAAASADGGASGTGLGLALVAEHARLHGGRVWVENRPGAGARFVLELPVVG